MLCELSVDRTPTIVATTFGEVRLDGAFECFSLEDCVRERPGVPVEVWKIPGQTAIPAGRYQVVLETSPKFGPDTLTLVGVPGFSLVRIHILNDDDETEGCIGVGQAKLVDPMTDGGDLLRSGAALKALKAKVVPRIKAGQSCFITIRNAPDSVRERH